MQNGCAAGVAGAVGVTKGTAGVAVPRRVQQVRKNGTHKCQDTWERVTTNTHQNIHNHTKKTSSQGQHITKMHYKTSQNLRKPPHPTPHLYQPRLDIWYVFPLPARSNLGISLGSFWGSFWEKMHVCRKTTVFST